MNSLPVTRQHRDCDLNPGVPGPSAPESSTLTIYGCHPSRISRDVPDLCHVVPRPGKTSPGTPNVPDFKARWLLSSDNTAVQSRGHCNWQIGSIFIAMLQMYRVRRPTHSCHQIASKCTKSHIEFQKFSGSNTSGRPSRQGLKTFFVSRRTRCYGRRTTCSKFVLPH